MMNRVWIGARLFIYLAALLLPPVLASQTAGQKTAQAPASLADQLRSPETKVRAKAARALGKSGNPSAVPALAGALSDSSVSVRREVVIALAQIHVPASLDPLVSATRDADDEVRVLAVKSLVGYYSGVIPSAGFTGFVKREYLWARGHFEIDTTRIDPGIVVDPKVVTALMHTMQDTSRIGAARQAAKGLGILVAQSAVPALVEKAHSSDEDLDREALNALAKIGDRSAGPRLMDLLDYRNRGVKRDAAVTVGILRTREALPKLQAMFENDPNQKDKEKALEGLAYLGQPVSVPLFIKALRREDKAMRASAAEGLARAGDPKAVPELEKSLSAEKNADVRLAMEFALTAVGRDDYLAALVHVLSSRLRGDDAQAYLRELSRDPKFLPKLYPFLSEHEAPVRQRLCTVLMFTGDQSSLSRLEPLSHDPDSDVAAEALRAMRAIRARAPAAAPASKA
jgi:HEAT repeat protein